MGRTNPSSIRCQSRGHLGGRRTSPLPLKSSSFTMFIVMIKQLLLYALVIFLLACPTTQSQKLSDADSRWTVVVADDGPHPTNKRINCYALTYFRDAKNLKEFDYGGDLLADLPEGNTDKVSSSRLGEISGFTIYDVIHRIGKEKPSVADEQSSRALKMILVERKAGEFCEIYHEQGEAIMLTVDSSDIVDVGPEKILATHDLLSGTGNFYNEAYWAFDKNGPIRLDLSLVDETVGNLMPSGMDVKKGGGFAIRSLTYEASVYKEKDPNCCPSGGTVYITFALKNHKLVVIEKRFEPAKRAPDRQDVSSNSD